MFYDSNTFYSLYRSSIWKHDVEGYTKFYNKKEPYVIEFTYANMNTFNPNSIVYYSRATEEGIDYPEITFDKAIVFNSKESTGIFDLIYNPIINEWSNTAKPVIEKDRNYRIAQIRDLSNGGNTYTTFNGVTENGYSDIEFLNTNYDKPLHEQPLFRDKYVRVRLYFNKNYRLETYYKTLLSTYSVR